MTYKFTRLKLHPKVELSDWLLEINNLDRFMDMHQSATLATFKRFGLNPHLADKPEYNPIKLASGWATTAMKGLTDHGVVYMNRNHGLFFGKIEILEERTSEKFEFPDGDNHKEGVRITISRYGGCQHYYLNSNVNRAFSQPKFNTPEEAIAEAKQHAFANNIEFSADYAYAKDGD